MTNRRTLLAYRRKSVVRSDADRISPELQAQAVQGLAAGRGWTCEWYEDVDGHRSGRTEAGRPGWLDLRAQIARPDVTAIGAYSLSRISRNVLDFLHLLDELEALDVAIVTVKESLDTSSAIGRAIVTILMSINQLESDLASERMTESISYRQRELGRTVAFPPFGTTRNDDQVLVPNDDQPVLEHAYRLYATGDCGYTSLANVLNEQGYRFRNRYGKQRPWTRFDVRRIVAAWQLYAGRLPLGRKKDRPDEIVPGAHDPIIDPELCAQVGAVLESRSPRSPRRRGGGEPARVYVLSGVLYCASCGQQLDGAVQDGTPRYRHRYAKAGCEERWIDAEQIERESITQLIHFLTSPALIDPIRAEADRQLEQRLDPHAIERAQDLRQQIDRLTDLHLEGHLDKGEYIERRRGIEAELEELRGQRGDDLHAIIDRIEQLVGHLAGAPPERQKALVESIYERLNVSQGRIISVEPRPWVRQFF